VGNCNNKIKTQPLGGLLMAGGGTDVDAGMKWFVDQSSNTSTKGDVVILRTSGADGYNQYLLDLAKPNSVTTIVFLRKEAASDSNVLNIVNSSTAVFFAGGDQGTYLDMWAGTPLSNLLTQLINSRVVFGGTSAGLAIQGQWIYTGSPCSATSSESLANPYNRCIPSFAARFLPFPFMGQILTDSHFYQRDRMGRSDTFLARLIKDNYSTLANYPIVVGVDEQTNIAVDSTGEGRMFGVGSAYLIQLSNPTTQFTCVSGTPLSASTFNVQKINAPKGDRYNFASRTGSGALYTFNITNGVFQGSPYGPSDSEM
jgi:cyanophycinase-like exopeptidase